MPSIIWLDVSILILIWLFILKWQKIKTLINAFLNLIRAILASKIKKYLTFMFDFKPLLLLKTLSLSVPIAIRTNTIDDLVDYNIEVSSIAIWLKL